MMTTIEAMAQRITVMVLRMVKATAKVMAMATAMRMVVAMVAVAEVMAEVTAMAMAVVAEVMVVAVAINRGWQIRFDSCGYGSDTYTDGYDNGSGNGSFHESEHGCSIKSDGYGYESMGYGGYGGDKDEQ